LIILLFKRHETAGVVAGLALGAFFLVQNRKLSFFPDNSVNRAGFLAGPTFNALLIDYLPQQ
jgi:hypothetical protein